MAQEISAEKFKEELTLNLIDNLAFSVKQVAGKAQWNILTDNPADDYSADKAGNLAMYEVRKQLRGDTANLPDWFLSCVEAVKTIIANDEMQGMECVAALLMATDRATAEQRVTAGRQLVGVLNPKQTGISALGMFGGFNAT